MLNAIDNITNPEGWAPLKPIGIAIHHTVTSMDVDATEAEERAHISTIDAYHVSLNYGGFGYHAIIFPSGRSYETGSIDGARAHVAKRNHELIGVALVGDYSDKLPSTLMMRELATVLNTIDPDQELPIMGHQFWALEGHGTECPGSLVQVEFDKIRNAPAVSPWKPANTQIAHALHFAYTGYWMQRKDTLHPFDRKVLDYINRWYNQPALPF